MNVDQRIGLVRKSVRVLQPLNKNRIRGNARTLNDNILISKDTNTAGTGRKYVKKMSTFCIHFGSKCILQNVSLLLLFCLGVKMHVTSKG